MPLLVPEAYGADGKLWPHDRAKPQDGPFSCPHCGAAVHVRCSDKARGFRCRPHFAHTKTQTDVEDAEHGCTAEESESHWLAKHLLAKTPSSFRFVRQCSDCSGPVADFSPGADAKGDIEVPICGKRVDAVIVEANGDAAAIEVWRTHVIGAEKRKTLADHFGAHRVFEVRASDVVDILRRDTAAKDVAHELRDQNHGMRCATCDAPLQTAAAERDAAREIRKIDARLEAEMRMLRAETDPARRAAWHAEVARTNHKLDALCAAQKMHALRAKRKMPPSGHPTPKRSRPT
jgi:hypothetical protein